MTDAPAHVWVYMRDRWHGVGMGERLFLMISLGPRYLVGVDVMGKKHRIPRRMISNIRRA